MTISEDRLTSPKYLAFMEKLVNHHYWTAADYKTIPEELVVEIYDGVIHMVPSASFDHQVTSGGLYVVLREAVGDPRQGGARFESISWAGSISRTSSWCANDASSRCREISSR